MKKTLVAFLIGAALPAAATTLEPLERDASARIVGGEPANTKNWKFIASLVKKGYPASEGHFCGGSFLGGKYVLTAAHCVDETNADSIDIVLGLYDQKKESQAQRIAVKNIYQHAGYNPEIMSNDIAVIELERSVDNATIELADSRVIENMRAGDKVYVAGWGDTLDESVQSPNILREVDVQYVDRAACQNLGGAYAKISVDAICAGYSDGGKDSCHGDSGGPLIANDNGMSKLLGVVSWGSGCAKANAYGVYANVAHFQTNGWIESHLNTISYTQYRDLGLIKTKARQDTFTIRNDEAIAPLNITEITLPEGVSVTQNTCTQTLAPSQSCELTINYTPDSSQSSQTIEFTTDHSKLPKFTTTLKYIAIDKASAAVSSAVPIKGTEVFTSGKAWTEKNGELQSSNAWESNGKSILYITDLPKGTLQLEYKALRANSNAFMVQINDDWYLLEERADFEQISIKLEKPSNSLQFVYVRDDTPDENSSSTIIASFEQAYIRNIKMLDSTDTSNNSDNNTNNDGNTDNDNNTDNTITDNITSANNSADKRKRSGGSFSIGLLVLLGAGLFTRRKRWSLHETCA